VDLFASSSSMPCGWRLSRANRVHCTQQRRCCSILPTHNSMFESYRGRVLCLGLGSLSTLLQNPTKEYSCADGSASEPRALDTATQMLQHITHQQLDV